MQRHRKNLIRSAYRMVILEGKTPREAGQNLRRTAKWVRSAIQEYAEMLKGSDPGQLAGEASEFCAVQMEHISRRLEALD